MFMCSKKKKAYLIRISNCGSDQCPSYGLDRAIRLSADHPRLIFAPQPHRSEGHPDEGRQQDQKLYEIPEHQPRRSTPAMRAWAVATSTMRMPSRPLTVTTSPLAINVPLTMMSSSSSA